MTKTADIHKWQERLDLFAGKPHEQGDCYLMMGQWASAIDCYSLAPKTAHVYADWGFCLQKLGLPAERKLQEAIAIGGDEQAMKYAAYLLDPRLPEETNSPGIILPSPFSPRRVNGTRYIVRVPEPSKRQIIISPD